MICWARPAVAAPSALRLVGARVPAGPPGRRQPPRPPAADLERRRAGDDAEHRAAGEQVAGQRRADRTGAVGHGAGPDQPVVVEAMTFSASSGRSAKASMPRPMVISATAARPRFFPSPPGTRAQP